MAERRRTVRAPILTQVEAQGERAPVLGRAKNISLGGLLIESPDTLPEGTAVIVRFFLPRQSHPIEAAGRVVRVEPDRTMAVAFLGLPPSQEERIAEYVRTRQTPPLDTTPFEARPSITLLRRTGRVNQRLPVVLSWQDEEGYSRQEATETVNLSKHGVMLLSFSELQPGQLVRVMTPGSGKETLARVVRAAPAQIPGRTEVALEFLATEDYWGIEFPVDRLPEPEGPKVARRRSARLPRRIGVTLNWVDRLGHVHEESGQTQMVSKHGAALRFPITLSPKQRCRVRVPLIGREAESHVVWVRPSEPPRPSALGIEFLETENFWNARFPPDPGSPLA